MFYQCVSWRRFQLVRYCYHVIWIGLVISEVCHLMRRSHHLDKNTWTLFYLSLRVTLCRWSAKQTIPLSVLARNQTKAWARDFDVTEVGKGTRVRSWTKELQEVSWRRATERGSWQQARQKGSWQSAWDRVQQ